MEYRIYKTTFQLRRATSSEWSEKNPILRLAEPAFETDRFKLKIGDGKTPYNDLEYINSGLEVDETTFKIDENGKLTLIGFNEAIEGAQPIKSDNGSLFWVKPKLSNTSQAGIMKLYDSIGENIDGTMTQKIITEKLNEKVSVSFDEEDGETLIFSV